VFYI
jgi:hypothetical protein